MVYSDGVHSNIDMTATAKKTAALIAAITAYAAEFEAAGDHAGFLEDFAIVAGTPIGELTDQLQDDADALKARRIEDERAEAEELAAA